MARIYGGRMPNSNKKTNSNQKQSKDLSETQILEIIEKQPDEVKESITKVLVSESISYEGPVPPPGLLKEFDKVIPNGADRIMSMAEKQLEHRISLESKVVEANNRDSLLGVFFAGMIGLIAISGAIYLLANNKNIQGLGIFIGTLATLIGVYLRSHKNDEQDLKNKK